MPSKAETGNRHAHSLLRVLRACLRRKDAESLHDFRVALRALLTLLPLQKHAPFRAWQKLFKASNAARDHEVMQDLLRQFWPEHPMLSTPAPRFKPRCKKLIRLTASCLHPVSATTAKRRQQRLEQAVLKKLSRPLQNSQDWHHLRIAIKRLRYIKELRQALRKKTAGKHLKLLKASQHTLGMLHDIDVLLTRCGAHPALERERGVRMDAALQAVRDLRVFWRQETISARF